MLLTCRTVLAPLSCTCPQDVATGMAGINASEAPNVFVYIDRCEEGVGLLREAPLARGCGACLGVVQEAMWVCSVLQVKSTRHWAGFLKSRVRVYDSPLSSKSLQGGRLL